jgi:hypothetical protein
MRRLVLLPPVTSAITSAVTSAATVTLTAALPTDRVQKYAANLNLNRNTGPMDFQAEMRRLKEAKLRKEARSKKGDADDVTAGGSVDSNLPNAEADAALDRASVALVGGEDGMVLIT